MKKAYMTIMILITVFCVIIGTAMHAFRFMSRIAKLTGRTAERSSHTIAPGDGESMEVAPFTTMKLDLGVGNITLMTGDGFDVSYQGVDELRPVIDSSKEGKLVIKQKNSNWRSMAKLPDAWGTDNDLVITVPEDLELEDLDCDLDMGDFRIEGIRAGKAEISMQMGNLNLKDSVFKTLQVDADMGNVTIDGIEVSKADLDANMGNIEAKGITGFSTLNLDADLGNIEIALDQRLEDLSLDLSADLGSVILNGEKKNGKISGGAGAARVSADADLGSIRINTAK
ncbi:MAG: DUF4097 domain-containing protein [Lachnospiraceae bacterium]|nr:DUF4097 domain-containing protein [Lachnospiraceae bacterium]